jgi:hypothetical protein
VAIARTLNVKHAILRSQADHHDLYRDAVHKGGAFDNVARCLSAIRRLRKIQSACVGCGRTTKVGRCTISFANTRIALPPTAVMCRSAG